MPTLIVNTTTDYSGTALSNISRIEFTNPVIAVATFAASQFGTGLISNSVAIDGSNGVNSVVVNDIGKFSAAAWSFTDWGGPDRVVLNGSILGNSITGSGQIDIINGNAGGDQLFGGAGADSLFGGTGGDTLTGGAGADSLSGGDDNDTFRMTSPADIDTSADETISGGAGTDSILFGAGTFSRFATNTLQMDSIEVVGFSGAGFVDFDVAQFGAVNGINTADFSGGEGRLSITGAAIDLSFLTVTGFTAGSDHLFLNAAAVGASAIGSAFADEVIMRANSLGGEHFATVDAGGGDDQLFFDILLGAGTYSGGSGNDALVFSGNGSTFAMRPAAIDGFEAISIDGDFGATIQVTGLQIAGFSTVSGSNAEDVIDVAATLGQTLDLSDLALVNWTDAQLDRFVITGTVLGDQLTGTVGRDGIDGGVGDDRLAGAAGVDTLLGNDGNDMLAGGAGGDSLVGGLGVDTADYRGSALGVAIDMALGTGSSGDALGDTLVEIEVILGSLVADVVLGDAGFNRFSGQNGNDVLMGLEGRDTLTGGSGKDTLDGGTGFDSLTGGHGRDLLTGGGDSDFFVFAALSDSRPGSAADRITDFTLGVDTLVLTGIDAVAGGGNDSFTILASGPFTAAGQLLVVTVGANTVIRLNTDADADAEAEIVLLGHIAISAGDIDL